MTGSPSRDDAGTMSRPVCQQPFTPPGGSKTAGDRCSTTAFQRRHQDHPGQATVPATRSRRAHTVYECPACEQHLPGEQRCPDCGIFARRTSTGGPRPHCAEPVAVAGLPQEVANMPASR